LIRHTEIKRERERERKREMKEEGKGKELSRSLEETQKRGEEDKKYEYL
jgi:hypothetical protein